MAYSTTFDVWKGLGKNAFTKVTAEAVGTGNGTTSTWDLDYDNVIDTTYTVYTAGTTVPTASYTIDLDAGKITGLTASDGDAVTADYNYADIEDSKVVDFISSSDKFIEEKTGRIFSLTTGAEEYLDVDEKQKIFFTRYYPIVTLSSVEQNTASSITDTPSWSTSTEGLGNDYVSNSRDLEIGRFQFIDHAPLAGKDRLRVTYSHGYSSTPALVEELSILLATRSMVNSAVYKAIFKGQDGFTPVRLDEIENRIQELINILKKQNISPA